MVCYAGLQLRACTAALNLCSYKLAALQLLVVHFSFLRLSRVSGVNPSLGPGLPVPESESLNQADSVSPPCQCAPAKLELELKPSTENAQWQGLVSLRVSLTMSAAARTIGPPGPARARRRPPARPTAASELHMRLPG